MFLVNIPRKDFYEIGTERCKQSECINLATIAVQRNEHILELCEAHYLQVAFPDNFYRFVPQPDTSS